MKPKTLPARNQHVRENMGLGITTSVGGFYRACNEVLMRLELLKNGTITVAFEVYKDFLNYKGGI